MHVHVISVKVPEPQFEGQTKQKLGNSEVRGLVESFVNEELARFLQERPPAARAILEKCLLAAKARPAARRARERAAAEKAVALKKWEKDNPNKQKQAEKYSAKEEKELEKTISEKA